MTEFVSRVSGSLSQMRTRRLAMAFYRGFVRPGSLCFDVGANVGERARCFVALQARVVVVEPQPECLTRLEGLAAKHPALVVEPVALGRAPGTAELHLASASTISSLAPEWIHRVRESGRFGPHEWSGSVTVEVSTRDLLIERHGRPDFTKIDVEGYEAEVVAGLSQPVPVLSFEFTGEWSQSAVEVIHHLDDLGMRRFNVSEGESFRLRWEGWRSSPEVIDYLQHLPPEGLIWGDTYVATGTL